MLVYVPPPVSWTNKADVYLTVEKTSNWLVVSMMDFIVSQHPIQTGNFGLQLNK